MPESFSYSKIVPEYLQTELINIRDNSTKTAWRLGSVVGEVRQYCENNKIIASDADIHSAIGSFAGKASRTIREYAHLAEFYPEQVRIDYEILSFDHFRVAATFGSGWMDVLEWAVQQCDELNRPATVDAMEAHFRVQPEGPTEEGQGDGAIQAARTATIQTLIRLAHLGRDALANGKIVLTPGDQEQVEAALSTIETILTRQLSQAQPA
jgi:hypothetical protein